MFTLNISCSKSQTLRNKKVWQLWCNLQKKEKKKGQDEQKEMRLLFQTRSPCQKLKFLESEWHADTGGWWLTWEMKSRDKKDEIKALHQKLYHSWQCFPGSRITNQSKTKHGKVETGYKRSLHLYRGISIITVNRRAQRRSAGQSTTSALYCRMDFVALFFQCTRPSPTPLTWDNQPMVQRRNHAMKACTLK